MNAGEVWVANTGDATFTIDFVYTFYVAGRINATGNTDGTPKTFSKEQLSKAWKLEPPETKAVRTIFVNVYRQGATIGAALRMRFFLTKDAADQFATANGLLGDRVAVARFAFDGAVA